MTSLANYIWLIRYIKGPLDDYLEFGNNILLSSAAFEGAYDYLNNKWRASVGFSAVYF